MLFNRYVPDPMRDSTQWRHRTRGAVLPRAPKTRRWLIARGDPFSRIVVRSQITPLNVLIAEARSQRLSQHIAPTAIYTSIQDTIRSTKKSGRARSLPTTYALGAQRASMRRTTYSSAKFVIILYIQNAVRSTVRAPTVGHQNSKELSLVKTTSRRSLLPSLHQHHERLQQTRKHWQQHF